MRLPSRQVDPYHAELVAIDGQAVADRLGRLVRERTIPVPDQPPDFAALARLQQALRDAYPRAHTT